MKKPTKQPTFMFLKEKDITSVYELKRFKQLVYTGLAIITLCLIVLTIELLVH